MSGHNSSNNDRPWRDTTKHKPLPMTNLMCTFTFLSEYETEFMESRCPEDTSANGVYMLHTNYVWELKLKCAKLNNVCRLPEPPEHRGAPARCYYSVTDDISWTRSTTCYA